MTIDVTGSSTLGKNQTLAFFGTDGIFLDGSLTHKDPSFTNQGTISSFSGGPDITVAGVVNGVGSFYAHSFFHNESTGTLSVSATGIDSTAIGVDLSGASFINDGLIEVSSENGFASALINFPNTDRTNNTINNGTIEVSALDAVGLYLFGGRSAENAGTVDVHGSSSAIGILSYQDDSDIDNSGSIVASSDEFASIGIFELPTNGLRFTINNSGLIDADYAIYGAQDSDPLNHDDMSIHITNTGTINGIIDLGSFIVNRSPDDTVVNQGTINGAVSLGSGDDAYDGTLGQQEGAVYGGCGNDVLVGTTSGDSLFGNEDSDVIEGLGGDDLADGGDGYDTFAVSGPQANYTVTGLGDGRFLVTDNVGPDGTDTIANFDAIAFSDFSFALTTAIAGTADDDTLRATEAADTIYGIAGEDTIYAGDSNDVVYGGTAGDDTIYGGKGDDLIDPGVSLGAVYGGGGDDTLSLRTWHHTFHVDLQEQGLIKLESVENVEGGDLDDEISGDDSGNRLYGNGGNDILDGAGGHDLLDGGSGVDYASFSSATTAIFANLARHPGIVMGDTLTNIEGIIGSDFDDTIYGSSLGEYFDGGKGDDTLDAAGGFDFVSYDGIESSGARLVVDLTLQGQAQNSFIAGHDTLIGFEGIIGWRGDELLNGDDQDNIFASGYGRNEVHGGGGTDTAIFNIPLVDARITSYGHGAVLVDGLGSNQSTSLYDVEFLQFTDQIVAAPDLPSTKKQFGTDGDDTLLPSAEVNRLYGLDGDDILVAGGSVLDRLFGGNGNDVLYTGRDTEITGGDGIDTVVFHGDRASYAFDTAAHGSRLNVVGLGGAHLKGVEKLQFADQTIDCPVMRISEPHATDGNNNFALGSFDNILEARGGDDNIDGEDGNDIIDGGLGDDTIRGGAGSDTASYAVDDAAVHVNLAIAGPQDTIGEGVDTLTDIENLTGSAFDDALTGSDGDNVLEGGAGDDILKGASGKDTASYFAAGARVRVDLSVVGAQNTLGAGIDSLTSMEGLIGSRWNDILSGNNGANAITGGKGNDALIGGDGADTLSGGEGVDRLTGGSGNDTFQFPSTLDSPPAASDTIIDLENHDVIDVSAVDADEGTVDDEAFMVVGAFSGHAGELVLNLQHGKTFLKADTDGDAQADMIVVLNGNHIGFTNFAL